MSEQTPATGALLEALATAVAGAVAALSGATAQPASVEAPGTPEWLVRVSASGAISGELQIGFSDQDARKLSELLMGLAGDEITDETVTDALREISNQAVATLNGLPEASAVTLSTVSVEKAGFDATSAASFAFQLPNDFVLVIVVDGGGTTAAEPASEQATTSDGSQPTEVAALAPLSAAPAPRNLDLLLDIELPLAVRFGQTELTLSTLTRLGPGSVIDLHRSADEPVEILVGGKMIARGEVVVVEGNYGVRVTEVLSTADRIRSLGA